MDGKIAAAGCILRSGAACYAARVMGLMLSLKLASQIQGRELEIQ
jgi:hypothetical protein